MSETSQNKNEEMGPRYGSYTTGSDECVIYDTEEPTAWIKSETSESIENRR